MYLAELVDVELEDGPDALVGGWTHGLDQLRVHKVLIPLYHVLRFILNLKKGRLQYELYRLFINTHSHMATIVHISFRNKLLIWHKFIYYI